MPTHTPSPHRFLAPSPPTPTSKPQSNLRNALSATTASKPSGSTTQKTEFRFKQLKPVNPITVTSAHVCDNQHVGSISQAQEHLSSINTIPHTTPRPRVKRKFERVESIESAGYSSPIETLESIESAGYSSPIETQDENGEAIMPTLEHDGMFNPIEETEDDKDDMVFTLAEPDSRLKATSLSSLTRLLPCTPGLPTSPKSPYKPQSPRFKTAASRNSLPFANLTTATRDQTSTTLSNTLRPLASTTPVHHRPYFLLPSLPTSPPRPSKPLLEIFSPSRKTGKHIQEGLASTVTSWIVETANTGYTNHAGPSWSREKGGGIELRIKVSKIFRGFSGSSNTSDEVDCFTGGICFVCGNTEPDSYHASRVLQDEDRHEEMRVLLAGQGGARSTNGVKVGVCSVVGIRRPLWDVEVGEEKWIVGIDWAVL